jgi:hypothetical protein
MQTIPVVVAACALEVQVGIMIEAMSRIEMAMQGTVLQTIGTRLPECRVSFKDLFGFIRSIARLLQASISSFSHPTRAHDDGTGVTVQSCRLQD